MPCNECEASNKNILILNPEKAKQLDKYIDSLDLTYDLNHNRGFLINCLHKTQALFGYLPEEVQVYIAQKLKLNLSDVYGVISFYSFFTTTPPGKYKISVCMGTACFVKGADVILAKFEEALNIKEGETTKDMKFSLGGLRCLGACSLAPVVLVNEKVYGKVKPETVAEIIKDCK